MIRDGALRSLARWRGLLIALGVMLLGLWWAWNSFGLLEWLGYVLVLVGLALMWTAWQRLRFGAGREGPGLVQVDEGQIAYFGPLTGGIVARSNLNTLSIDPDGKPAHWVLGHSGGDDLAIPVTATGTEALFDYFSALPGMRLDRLLTAARGGFDTRTRLWSRPAERTRLGAPK